jgi:hypothetical protein
VHVQIVEAVEFAVGAQADDRIGFESLERDIVLFAGIWCELTIPAELELPAQRRRSFLQPVRKTPCVKRIRTEDLMPERKASAAEVAGYAKRGFASQTALDLDGLVLRRITGWRIDES